MDAPIRTARLVLMPVEAEDADELAVVFADERLYAFTGEGPGTVEELRGILGRLARERAADPWAQRNWVVRRLADRQAVGTLQVVTDETRTTDKHEHVERLWRRDLSPGGRLDPALR
jgi:RimJ/RimL family protein N-acetyltransferase